MKSLEARLETIDALIEKQATFSLQTGAGAIGERSAIHEAADTMEWFEVTFEKPVNFDQVVIVPALWRDERRPFMSDGFPEEFYIEVTYADREEREVLARYTAKDGVVPRTAPLVVDISAQQVTHLRVVATKLSARVWDGAYVFQLSEILVFNGQENVALHQKVKGFSEEGEPDHGARRREFLVDGNLPYQMDATPEDMSHAYRFRTKDKRQVNFSVDLGREVPVSRLLFHTLEVTDSIPHSNRPDFGLPRHFKLYGSQEADFSEKSLLTEYRYRSVYDYAPIIHLSFPEVSYRYYRITLVELDYATVYEVTDPFHFFAAAEIELLSKGVNVLKGRVLQSDYKPNVSVFEHEGFQKENLNDGKNMFGNILGQREWLGQLAKRHELETERPLVLARLNEQYAKQEGNIRNLQWLLAVVVVVVGLGYHLSRLAQVKRISKIRERFAADLHDELGANLHAIGILSDVAENSVEEGDMDHLRRTVSEIRATTMRTADSVRHSIYSEDGRPLERDFQTDMERIAKRTFAGMDYEIAVEGEARLRKLPLRRRHDLFLFYKECLANISRHSSATTFSALVKADEKEVSLTVSDNGVGDRSGETPASLLRRAKLLKARLEYESSSTEPSGVTVRLCFKPSRPLLTF